MEGWLQDLRIGARGLRRRPALALGVVVTLGLGIGATTTVYSVVDGVLVRPLPYEEPSQLVAIGRLVPDGGVGASFLGGPGGATLDPLPAFAFRALQERARSFERVGGIEPAARIIPDGGDGPEIVPALRVTPELFPLLGGGPLLGRVFLPEEYTVAGGDVLMISEGAWRRRYGADPDVVGRTLEGEEGSGTAATVVGVLPSDFSPGAAFYPADEVPEFYLPMPLDHPRYDRGTAALHVIARLSPSSSIEQARGDLSRLAAELGEEERDLLPDGAGPGLDLGLVGLHEQTVGSTADALWLFLGAASLLLLLASMNAATLLLTFAMDRSRDLSVRVALGAARRRVVRLLLLEAVILSVGGGVLGLLVAYGGVGVFLRLAPSELPRLSGVGVDGRVLAVATVVSLGAGIVAGALPAIRAAFAAPWSRIQDTAPAGARPDRLLSSGLVGGQMALAVVLLSAAGLLFGSFLRIRTADPGFEPHGLVTMSENIESLARSWILAGTRPTSLNSALLWDAVTEPVGAVPGVEAVGASSALPFESSGWAPRLVLRNDADEAFPEGLPGYVITPSYFDAIGAVVSSGRGFVDSDGIDDDRVAIVNRAFVRARASGREIVGEVARLVDGARTTEVRIVGVVEDIVQGRIEDGVRPAVFVPYAQRSWPVVQVVARSSLPEEVLLPELRRVASRINSSIPSRDQRSMRALIALSRTSPRFQAALMGAFAVVALLLAAAGLYASLAHAVARRRHELGVRIALGADRSTLLRWVLARALTPSLGGLAAGAVGALAVSRLLRGLLYGITSTDPTTLACAVLVLASVALAACLLPARRAAASDPVEALRAE